MVPPVLYGGQLKESVKREIDKVLFTGHTVGKKIMSTSAGNTLKVPATDSNVNPRTIEGHNGTI
jgi:hypothetical protein